MLIGCSLIATRCDDRFAGSRSGQPSDDPGPSVGDARGGGGGGGGGNGGGGGATAAPDPAVQETAIPATLSASSINPDTKDGTAII